MRRISKAGNLRRAIGAAGSIDTAGECGDRPIGSDFPDYVTTGIGNVDRAAPIRCCHRSTLVRRLHQMIRSSSAHRQTS
jgi:hypothetical protein